MRLNGLGAPDEVILVPLNKIETAKTKTETKPAGNTTQNTTQNTKKNDTVSTATNSDTSKRNAEN